MTAGEPVAKPVVGRVVRSAYIFGTHRESVADDFAVTFVHPTDLHIEPFGSLAYGTDTQARLRRVARWIRDSSIDPRSR